jgi:hypothetical protein
VRVCPASPIPNRSNHPMKSGAGIAGLCHG